MTNTSNTYTKLHYTRGYCPIPREYKLLTLYTAIKKGLLTKIFVSTPIKYIMLLGVLALSINNLELEKSKLLNYQNYHTIEAILKILQNWTQVINLCYVWLIRQWLNLKKKHRTSMMSYEESGQLDSKLWKKPCISLIQDLLILTYKIEPIIKKLFYQMLFYNTIITFIFFS